MTIYVKYELYLIITLHQNMFLSPVWLTCGHVIHRSGLVHVLPLVVSLPCSRWRTVTHRWGSSLNTGEGAANMASSYYQEMQEVFRNNNKSREFQAHSAKVHSVAWSCDGKRLASGSFDKTASVFVLEKDRLVRFGLSSPLPATYTELFIYADCCYLYIRMAFRRL